MLSVLLRYTDSDLQTLLNVPLDVVLLLNNYMLSICVDRIYPAEPKTTDNTDTVTVPYLDLQLVIDSGRNFTRKKNISIFPV